MNRKINFSLSFVILLAVFVVALAINNESFGQMQKNAEAQTNNKTIAFLNVSVVPMDSERVLENQTVIVSGGRIAEIGSANKIKVLNDAVKIDGRGKFLMPGLADMHAHLQTGAGTLDDAAGQQLQLFLMNGVTTVRNMIGKPEHLVLRDKINRGELVAPTIFTAGPPIIVNRIASPEAAIKDVTEQKNAGYDLIKVHEGISPETYTAMVETANKVGIPFAGHVTATVGLERALKARQTSIEHLDGYIQHVIADSSPVKPTGSQVQLGEVLNYVDEKKIPAVIKQTKDANVWNCPTLALFQIIVSPQKSEDLLKLPELKYVPQKVRDAFARQKQPTEDIPANESEKYTRLRFRLVREMQKSGAKLLVGSDPGQMFLVAGFGTHKELQSFVEAGLSPYQALEATTKNPAEYLSTFMKIPNDFGIVKVGNKADLLLLDANPLQSISNTEKIAGVMTHGRWISKDEINKTLDKIAYAQTGSGQSGNASSYSDREAIRAAALDYIESIYEVNPAKVERSVHPDLAKRGFFLKKGETAYTPLTMTFAELVDLAKNYNKDGRIPKDAVKEVTIFDVSDQTASAKVTAVWGIDYLHLAKYEGRWKIINVLWQSLPKKNI